MLFVDDMFAQVENPKEFPKKEKEKFLELVWVQQGHRTRPTCKINYVVLY